MKIAINEDFKSRGENTLKGLVLYMLMFFVIPLVLSFVDYGLFDN